MYVYKKLYIFYIGLVLIQEPHGNLIPFQIIHIELIYMDFIQKQVTLLHLLRM